MSSRLHECPICRDGWHCIGCETKEIEKVCDNCEEKKKMEEKKKYQNVEITKVPNGYMVYEGFNLAADTGRHYRNILGVFNYLQDMLAWLDLNLAKDEVKI